MYRRVLGQLQAWLLQENELTARAQRSEKPHLVAHYWDGSVPEGRSICDISQTGLYINTSDRWYIGTIIRIIIQEQSATVPQDDDTPTTPSICVAARVVRHGPDGLGLEFVFRDKEEKGIVAEFLAKFAAQPGKNLSARVTADTKGQALIEFALIIPLVFILAVNALNFGGFIFAWITVANAARAGAQYMIMSSDSPGAPTAATLAQITALVTNDVTSLLNRSSVVVSTCTNKTTAANGCTTLFDPEAPAYTLATVDVTYTYVPYIPLFPFPKLGISATLPSTIIHRKAVMRMMQ